MLEILVNWGNPLRSIAVMLDSIAFNLIDNAYSLIYTFASGSLFKVELIQTVMNNTYVIIGIFALFRIALILVNAMINPDKLNEKGNGIGNVLINLVVMFVLLIMTPILFRELVTGYTKSDGTKEKSLQQIIVEGNYIQKIFLNSPEKGWSDDNSEPAATMRTIAASSLITIDKEVRDNPECAKDKDTKCSKAVKAYDNMVDKNDFKFSEIAKYVSYQIEVNGEDVYIYNYKMFITFAAGIAVTYLLLNFALKLALRMIELTVLEMVAPMFIATYIDPKSAKSGPFSKWLKTVGTTYASLFIDIAIISIMLLFVSLLGNSGGLSEELKGFSKIVMLFAILIFAKKAPKWISDMIGVEGTGFKGIGKTLKEDMLGGSLAAKVGRTAAGLATGAALGAHAARKANRVNRAKEGKTIRSRAHKAGSDAAASKTGKLNKARAYMGSYFKSMGGTGAKENWNNMWKGKKENIRGGFGGMLTGATSGIQAGWDSDSLKDMHGKVKANAKGTFENYAPGYVGPMNKVAKAVSGVGDKIMDNSLGDSFEREERKKEAAGIEKATDRYDKVHYTISDKDGKRIRDKKLNPVSTKEINEMMSGYSFDASSMEGICGGLIQGRIESGELSGIKLSDDGKTVYDKNGIKISSSSEYCKANGIYNSYGEKEIEAAAKENAYTKATQYSSNSQKIDENNKAAAAATNQMLEMKAKIDSSGLTAAFAPLNNAINDQLLAIRKLNNAISEGASESSIVILRKAVEDAGNNVKTAADEARKDKNMDIGMLEGFVSASQTRADAVNTVTVLTEENKNIKTIIEASIETEGKDSNYHVKDITTGEEFDLLKDPTKTEYGITLIEKALSKAKSDAEELKPKKDNK